MSPLRRTVKLASLSLGVLAAVAVALPGDAAPAPSPRSLAELLPDDAVAVVETDDLRALLKRWRDSKLHRGFERSRAEHDLERSRLYLRLAQNVGELEEVAGFGLSLDRLTQLAGHRSAIALYDVPSTSFVLVTELSSDEARRTDLFGQKGRMAQREHRGVKYLLKEGERGKSSLAVALVGERLIAGSDLKAFRGTLVLAARAAGVAVAPAKDDPSPLAEHPDFSSLDKLAPRVPVRMWVNQRMVSGTHYFDDYWIFGKETGADMDAAMVTFEPGDDLAVESRLYLYADGKRPDVAEDARVEIGRADAAGAVAALPPAPPFASAWPADGDGAARAIVELLPRGAPSEDGVAPAPIAAALAPAKPRRVLEVVDPSHPKNGFAEHHGALAVALAAPDALDAKALEKALAQAVAPRVTGAGSELAFTDDGAGADAVRALALPLVSEWALAWKRAGAALVIGTDPAACRKLAAALADPKAAALLGPSAPRLYRLEVERAGAVWRDVTRTLAQRQNWSDSADSDLYEKSIGGLFDVAKDWKRVVAVGYARGPQLYIEEVQYRTK